MPVYAVGIGDLDLEALGFSRFLAAAVERAVGTERQQDQRNAVSVAELTGALDGIVGACEKRKLLVGDFQNIDKAENGLHPLNSFFLAVPEIRAVVGIVGNDGSQLLCLLSGKKGSRACGIVGIKRTFFICLFLPICDMPRYIIVTTKKFHSLIVTIHF